MHGIRNTHTSTHVFQYSSDTTNDIDTVAQKQAINCFSLFFALFVYVVCELVIVPSLYRVLNIGLVIIRMNFLSPNSGTVFNHLMIEFFLSISFWTVLCSPGILKFLFYFRPAALNHLYFFSRWHDGSINREKNSLRFVINVKTANELSFGGAFVKMNTPPCDFFFHLEHQFSLANIKAQYSAFFFCVLWGSRKHIVNNVTNYAWRVVPNCFFFGDFIQTTDSIYDEMRSVDENKYERWAMVWETFIQMLTWDILPAIDSWLIIHIA